jgi:hypothetical protein
MRLILTAAAALFVGTATADDKKGTPAELAGMKSAPPASWKVKPLPANSMRQMQFDVPKAEGDAEDAEVAVFKFTASGTVEQNLKRQLDKFVADGRKDKADKIKVGAIDATYQDVSGTYKKKPFPMAEKFTPKADWRQLYVVFNKGDDQYYVLLLGPAKTVEKNKAGFEDWLKNFK